MERAGRPQLRTTLRDLASSRITDASTLRAMLRELQDETVLMLAETLVHEEPEAAEQGTMAPEGTSEWRVTEVRMEDLTVSSQAEPVDDQEEEKGEAEDEGMLDFD